MLPRFRPAALLLLPALALGCGLGEGEDPEEGLSPYGTWNADMRWETRDGEAIASVGYATFRINQTDEGGYACYFYGRPASLCSLDPETGAFDLSVTYASNYSSYVRTRTLSISALQTEAGDRILTAMTDDYAYVFTDGGTSDLRYTGTADLRRVERFDDALSQGLTLVGEHGDFATAQARGVIAHEEEDGGKSSVAVGADGFATANVRVKGDYAYLARFDDGLRVVDISDPANIRNVGHGATSRSGGGYFNDIKLFEAGGKDYAALSDSRVGLAIFDVSDPSAPRWVANGLPEGMDPGQFLNNHTAFMVGTTAYLANYPSLGMDPIEGSGGLLILDLSNPEAPLELGSWLARDIGGSFVHDLYIEDGIAYLCAWEAGLVVLDVHDPAEPKLLGRFTYDRMTSHSVWVTEVGGRKVAVHGDEDFGSHVRIIDVDPESSEFMTEIGDFELRPEVSVHNIMAEGDLAVAAWYQDGVRVLDLTDPTDPQLVGWYNSWKGYEDPTYGYGFFEGGIGVDLQGDRLYLADIQRGLLVFDLDL